MADEVFYGFFAIVILFIALNIWRARRGSWIAARDTGHEGTRSFSEDVEEHRSLLDPLDPNDPLSIEYKNPFDR